MFAALQRHPLPIDAHFDFSLVLTYAFPREILAPLLPPGLELDTHEGFGFAAVALVQTRALRPAFLPGWAGLDFFLIGYRLFTRYQSTAGRKLRGLYILRSDTNRRLMQYAGNQLTHYRYHHAAITWRRVAGLLSVEARTPRAEADLSLNVLTHEPNARLPSGSPFADWHTARLFAGPMPFTFDYERATHSMVLVEGVREHWHPQPVSVESARVNFFDQPPFAHAAPPRLANAFLIENISYHWKRGQREPLPGAS